jgi:tagaturonate reductase
MMNDADFMAYINKGLFEEIIPVLDLPKDELEYFANAVIERFKNPFIKHLLLSIALNSVSKYKVRVLPSLLEYNEQFGKLPKVLTFGLAALIEFYKGDEANDDAAVMEFMKNASVSEILANTSLWDTDLSFMEPTVSAYVEDIRANGMRAAVKKVIA